MKRIGYIVAMVTDGLGNIMDDPCFYMNTAGWSKSIAIENWDNISHHMPHRLTRKRKCMRTVVVPIEYGDLELNVRVKIALRKLRKLQFQKTQKV